VVEGTTPKVLPPPDLRAAAEAEGCHFSFSYNHWSSQATMKFYMWEVIEKYLVRKRKELKLRPDFPCIILLDCWSVHKSKEFLTWVQVSVFV
jgi:hypothetical protein